MTEFRNVNDDDDVFQQYVRTRLQIMSPLITGLIFGLLLGGVIFLATNFLILKGGEVVGPHLALLGQYFIGYQVTFTGSLVGLGYGMMTGFIVGFIFAWLYNQIARLRETRLTEQKR